MPVANITSPLPSYNRSSVARCVAEDVQALRRVYGRNLTLLRVQSLTAAQDFVKCY